MYENAISLEEIVKQFNLSQGTIAIALELLCKANLISKNENNKYSIPMAIKNLLPLAEVEIFTKEWHERNLTLDTAFHTGRGQSSLDVILENHDVLKSYGQAMANASHFLALLILRFIQPRQNINIIDIGGSQGDLLLALSPFLKNCELTVVDFAQHEALFKNKVSSSNNNAFAFIAADINNFVKEKSSIDKADFIILSNILHLLPRQQIEIIFENLYENTKKDCCLIIYDQFINKEQQQNFDMADFMLIDWINCGTNFSFSQDEMKAIIKQKQFPHVKTRKAKGLPGDFLLIQK